MRAMKGVDVLYAVGTESRFRDFELRFSLRCLARHARNLGRVVVAGHVPDFVGGDAIAVPCGDEHGKKKALNIFQKLRNGMDAAGLDRPFLFSADDHFITADADLAAWPRYERGTAHDAFSDVAVPTAYHWMVRKTGLALLKRGYPDLLTVWHGNMWVAPDCVGEAWEMASDPSSHWLGRETFVLLHNVEKRKRPETEFSHLDADVRGDGLDSLLADTKRTGCHSTGPMLDDRVRAWFKRTYPDKCRFER